MYELWKKRIYIYIYVCVCVCLHMPSYARYFFLFSSLFLFSYSSSFSFSFFVIGSSNNMTFLCVKINYFMSPILTPFFPHGAAARTSSLSRTDGHTQSHHTRQDFSGRVTSPTSIWQHRKIATDIHAPGGIRTHNPSKRTAADPRLRPLGHCHCLILTHMGS